MRWAVALAALLCAAPTSSQAGPPPYQHDETAIVRVHCARDGGTSVGTAVKIGPAQYITAAHVVASGECFVGVTPLTVEHFDRATDFAMFTGPSSPASLPIDCDGLKSGRLYLARGYAGGEFFNVAFPWLATELTSGAFRVFIGEAIPGMSGGTLLNREGRVSGLVNMRWPARGIPLSETKVCQ